MEIEIFMLIVAARAAIHLSREGLWLQIKMLKSMRNCTPEACLNQGAKGA